MDNTLCIYFHFCIILSLFGLFFAYHHYVFDSSFLVSIIFGEVLIFSVRCEVNTISTTILRTVLIVKFSGSNPKHLTMCIVIQVV